MPHAKPLHPITRRAQLGFALVAALVASGCERTLFAFVNRGQAPPEATVAFAPDVGLSLDVYRPRATTTPAPVVVFFYGGAWRRGARAEYRFVGRRLAQQGYVAVIADYRTYPRARFPAFVDDAARAVRWTHDHAAEWGGDPRRLVLAGHSAGAQIAALLALDGRYLRRHALSPERIAGVIGLSGPYDFDITGDLVPIFGPPAQWDDAQPVNFANAGAPPFLLVHGEQDTTVESRDSVELARALVADGVPATLLLLSEGKHSTPLAGFYEDKRAPQVLPAIASFINAVPATR